MHSHSKNSWPAPPPGLIQRRRRWWQREPFGDYSLPPSQKDCLRFPEWTECHILSNFEEVWNRNTLLHYIQCRAVDLSGMLPVMCTPKAMYHLPGEAL